MKKLIPLFLILPILYFSSCTSLQKSNVLLITGGHSFDTTEFFDLFYSLHNINLDTISQPAANEFLVTEEGKKYDVYVLYDMWKNITLEQKEAYLELTEAGKGFVFLHHSLVSYNSWNEFKNLVGGRYHQPLPGKDSSLYSNYKHDIDLYVNVLDPTHPVTETMSNFIIHDEGYGNLDLTSDIQPLLTTDHPDCHPVIGWTNLYNNSKVVYLIFGHDKKAYESPEFKELIVNAIDWVQE